MNKNILYNLLISLSAIILSAEFSFAEVPEGIAGFKIGDNYEKIKTTYKLIPNKPTGPITEEEKICGIGDYYINRDNSVRINLTFSRFLLTDIVFVKILTRKFDITTLSERFKTKFGEPSKASVQTDLAHLFYKPSQSSAVDEFSIWIYYGRSGEKH